MTPAAMLAHAGGALALALAVLLPALALWRLGAGGWPRGRAVAALALGLFFVFLALHPFPEPGALDCGPQGRGVPAQLHPLRFLAAAGELWAAGAPPLRWLGDRVVATAALNFALFAGIGALLAGGRRPLMRPAAAVAAGAGLSLAIETAQLTGMFGLYPCAFRQFDVDDLILNALGCLAGVLALRRRQTESETR